MMIHKYWFKMGKTKQNKTQAMFCTCLLLTEQQQWQAMGIARTGDQGLALTSHLVDLINNKL